MTIELGVLLSILGFILAFLGYQLNKQRETKNDSRIDAETRTQLNYISKGVDDIRIDLKSNERQMVTLGERITRVEESSKQAHKRIDSLEGGNNE